MKMEQADMQEDKTVSWSFSLLKDFSILTFINDCLQWSKRTSLSPARVLEWFARFWEGQKSLLDDVRTGTRQTAVNDTNIFPVKTSDL
jgi:hypothetical protein